MASPFLHPGVNMNKKLIGALIAIVVVICGYLYATPYLALNNIKKAAQAGDSDTVSKYIDYPSVRQSFKDQMNAMMVKEMAVDKDANGWEEALGAMIATTMVEKMVDAVVTPEGMTLMLQGKDFKDSLKHSADETTDQAPSQEKLNYSTRYLSMSLFEVTLKNEEKGSQLKVIMERDGLSWKVKKLVVPMDEVKSKQAQQQVAPLVDEVPVEVEAPSIVEQPQVTFDFSGIQKGAQFESCYHDPCSIGRVMGFKQLSQTPTEAAIEVTIVGGSRGWEAKDIEWNHKAHKIQIQCSMTKPTVQVGDQVTIVPLNDSGVPGVLWSDAETYMQACHNYTGEMGAGIRQYGYNVESDL